MNKIFCLLAIGVFLFLIGNVSAAYTRINMTQTSVYADGYLNAGTGASQVNSSGEVFVGNSGGTVIVAYMDFNTSVIPDSAIINNISIELTLSLAGSGRDDINITVLPNVSSSFIPADLAGNCTDGNITAYNSNVFSAVGVGNSRNITMNSNASNVFQTLLSSDRFSFCLVDGTPSFNDIFRFNSSESGIDAVPRIYVDYTPDGVAPSTVTITSPIANKTYNGNEFPIRFNVSMNENGSANYTLNGLVNYSMQGNETAFFGKLFNASNATSLADGNYTMFVWALDEAGNVNRTVNLSFVVDTTKPVVTINSPAATTFTTNTYLINITLNEAGLCRYSLDSGVTNNSLTNLGWMNTTFNATLTGVSNGAYTLNAYCNDTAGNTNLTTSVSYTVSVSSGGGNPGGGGGGGGSVNCNAFTYSPWGTCVNGIETRTVLTSSPLGCTGGVVPGPLTQSCILNETCATGNCNNETPTPDENHPNPEPGSNKNISFEDVAHVIDNSPLCVYFNISGAPCIVSHVPIIPIVGGIAWWIFLAILSSFLPFFLIKLRHYSVSVFDSGNQLGMIDKKGEVNNTRLYSMLLVLEKNFGTLVFAGKEHNVMKYLIKSGFVEVRLDEPFIMTGHFVKSKDMALFKNALKETINKFGGRKVTILENIERASIIRVWRAYMRARKSQKELAKVVRR